MRRAFVVVSATALVAVACTTDYQKGLDDPNYGAPNALAGQQPPQGTQLGDGGDPTGSGSSTSTTTATPLCVTAGGTLADGGTCSVSFATDVLGALAAGGCDSASCHGGATPANQPAIDLKSGPTTWASFAQYKATNGKPYIDPCSLDPNDSVFAFNLDPTADAGARGTEMPPSAGLPAAVTTVTTWVKCGAPNN